MGNCGSITRYSENTTHIFSRPSGRYGQNDVRRRRRVSYCEEGRSQCGTEWAGIDIVNDVGKIKNDLLIGFPQCIVLIHFLQVRPYDAIRYRLCSRRAKDLDITEIHDPKPIKLATLGSDCEINSDAIEVAGRRSVVTCQMSEEGYTPF